MTGRHRLRAEPRFRVLGAVTIAGADDATNSPRVRRLLAGLLIHAGSVVSVDRLADIIWGDAPPANVDNALHSLVSRLRGTLRAAGIDAGDNQPLLRTQSPGYLLRLEPGDLDAQQFADLVAAARDTPASDAVNLLDHALLLWRGSAYAEFASAPFARTEVARLEELRATARSDHAQALLALGRHDEAITHLETLTADHPLSERPHVQLMLALHHAGRTPDALAVFRQMHARLNDELGIDPGADLQDLHTRLLRRDAGLQAPPVMQRRATSRGNVPSAVTALIGRDDALAELCDKLATTRLITLTGPGGVGKTALALAVARTAADGYRDGAWVFELASIVRTDEVADVVSTTLDLPQQDTGSALDRLVDTLGVMHALLVVDNCEHVIDNAARMIAAIARRCPDVTILATSRQALGVPGEHLWPVPPLALAPDDVDHRTAPVASSPAVRLFRERARAAAPAFKITADNAGDVQELCRRLDGLPLAIELAAMRMPAMTAAEVVARLPMRLQFLRSTQRLIERRHQTLRAVIDWSYDALDPAEQRCFETLSVFAGSFTATAAEHVIERVGLDPAETVDLLGGLVERSLVSARPGRPATRYVLLETLRDYGLQRLADRDVLERTQAAHATHWVTWAQQTSARLFTRELNDAADALAREMAELRSVHGWALEHDLDLALQLLRALIGYAHMRLPTELFTWAQRTIDAAKQQNVTSPDLATAHALVATGARVSGDLAAARRHVAEVTRHDAAEAAFAHHHALYVLSDVALFEGRLAEVHAIEQQRRALPDVPDIALISRQAMLNQALAYAYGGDAEAALELAEQLRAAVTADDPPDFTAYAPYAAAEALMEQDPVRASQLIDEALAVVRRGRDRLVLGIVMVSAASLHLRLDEPERALVRFREVVAHWRQLGLRTMLWTTLRNVVALLAGLDATADAATLLGVITTRHTAAPIYGTDQQRLDTIETTLRARLGAERFTQAHAQGAGMNDDAAMRFVTRALASVQL